MARPGLRKHPKFLLLCHLLGVPEAHAWGHLEMLWEVAYESGNPVIGNAVQVELAAGWKGERGALTRALVDCKGSHYDHGFIEPVAEKADCFQVHDLYANAPDYVQKRLHREQERNARCKTISDLRRDAAKAMWEKKKGIKQTSAVCNANVLQTAANGETPCTQHAHPAPTPTPAPKDVAASPPAAEPLVTPSDDRLSDTARDKPAPKLRPRNELFDAVAEVTSSDPKASGAFIGRVVQALRSADPPYTPAEVRAWRVHPDGGGWIEGVPSLGHLQKTIGVVRAKPVLPKPQGGKNARPNQPDMRTRDHQAVNGAGPE